MLTIRTVETQHGALGGVALVVCDDNGEPLPTQTACTVAFDTADGAVPTVTLKLVIDGEHVRMGDVGTLAEVGIIAFTPLHTGVTQYHRGARRGPLCPIKAEGER